MPPAHNSHVGERLTIFRITEEGLILFLPHLSFTQLLLLALHEKGSVWPVLRSEKIETNFEEGTF